MTVPHSDCPYGPMLGEHSAEIRNLKDDVHGIRGDQQKMLECLQRIDRHLAEQSGGAKVLLWAAGAAATAGGLVSSLLGHFWRNGS